MDSPLLLVLGITFVLAALVLVVLAVLDGTGGPIGVARSLAIIERQISHIEVGKSELPARERLLLPTLDRSRRIGLVMSPKGTSDRIARLLDMAGNPPDWPLERVLGAKGVCMIALGILGLLIGGLSVSGLIWAAVFGLFGLFLPDILTYNAGLKRQDLLRTGLADSLDMLTISMEAGQSFDGALLQVARSVDGPIAGEFARVLSEIQIGRSRADAFQGLEQRTTPTEMKAFVSAVVQADRLGLPIANVLREQSRQMRLVRRQRAEESAQKVPVKILFPMMFCIFPALLVVVVGPGILRIMGLFAATH